MILKRLIPAGALAVSLAMGGCGDATGGGTTGLSASNIAELLHLILVDFDPKANSFASATITATCGLAGTVVVDGSAGDPAGGNSTTFDITETYNGCNDSGLVIAGSLKLTGTITATETTLTGNEALKGTLTLTPSGSPAVSCVVDMTVTFTSKTAQTNAGTICGMDAKGL